MSVDLRFLRIPLYHLYYLNDVSEFSGLTPRDVEFMRSKYTASEFENIVSVVRWAVNNKEFDFSSMLPELGHSNEDIYKYLCVLERSFYDANL